MSKPNAIPGGSKMPLDRKFKATPGGGGGGAWLNTGNSKEIGKSNSSQQKLNNLQKRGSAKVFGTEDNISESTGTSIFDPVLCELIYRWFSGQDDYILDPFAGGSVRGVVASKLNRNYVGIELRQEQVDENRLQAKNICHDPHPQWICGNSLDIENLLENDKKFNLLFSCPPYADLEVYSDNPEDLSTMEYEKFLLQYSEIIKKSCEKLHENSFACFVVGEVRSKKNCGIYYNFVGDTIRSFIDAGLGYYNEAILLTAIGSLPVRAGKPFESSRKLGKTHQNILIFVKGDPKKATQRIGACEFGDITSEETHG